METADFSQLSFPLAAGGRQGGRGRLPSHPRQAGGFQTHFTADIHQPKAAPEKPKLSLNAGPGRAAATSSKLRQRRGWQGWGFHDTSSLEFAGECPTASVWCCARAASQILRDLPAAEGRAASMHHPGRRQEQQAPAAGTAKCFTGLTPVLSAGSSRLRSLFLLHSLLDPRQVLLVPF